MTQSEQDRSPWVGQPGVAWNEDDAVGVRDAYVIIAINYVNAAQELQEQV